MAKENDFENSMTIFYNKRTGKIVQVATGVQSMNIFGEEKEDFDLIWDFIIVKKDDYVMRNPIQFFVEVETRQLVYVSPVAISNYKVL